MTLEELQRSNALTVRYYSTPPSQHKTTFTAEEIAILKANGVIARRRGPKYLTNEQAAASAAAYTALNTGA